MPSLRHSTPSGATVTAASPDAQLRVRLVFADDDDGMRTMIRTLLALVDGVEIVGEAADGEEAVRLVQELRPDLVLLDVQMPRLDGPSAAEVIRALRPETRVVLHTALPERRDAPPRPPARAAAARQGTLRRRDRRHLGARAGDGRAPRPRPAASRPPCSRR